MVLKDAVVTRCGFFGALSAVLERQLKKYTDAF
jgi:hypothetical protein